MRNLTMIGMPSSGKSVIGVLLAKRLGMSFLDLDLLIQERSGKLLRQLIEEHGREGFLRIEEGYASALSVQNTVISPGGSICYEREAMRHLREISTIIYLDISYPGMSRRAALRSPRDIRFWISIGRERCSMRRTRISGSMRRGLVPRRRRRGS